MKRYLYFVKRVGRHWEVWMRYADGTHDLASGASEWRQVWGVRFWRKLTAERVAKALQGAYNAGEWTAE